VWWKVTVSHLFSKLDFTFGGLDVSAFLMLLRARSFVRQQNPWWCSLAIAGSMAVSACSGDAREVLTPDDVVSIASDTQGLEAGSSLGLWAALLPATAVNPQQSLAENLAVAGATESKFRPRSCFSTQTVGNRVIYAYNKCLTGSGILSGEIQARFQSADVGVDIEITGSVTLGSASLQFSGSTQVRSVDGQREISWRGSISGTRKRQPFVYESQEAWRFAQDGCWTRSGIVNGERGNRSRFSVEHDQLRRCNFQSCPSGRVRVVGNLIRNPNRRFSAELLFDGSTTLRVRDEAGAERLAQLNCNEDP
jgi:hypothetical protein